MIFYASVKARTLFLLSALQAFLWLVFGTFCCFLPTWDQMSVPGIEPKTVRLLDRIPSQLLYRYVLMRNFFTGINLSTFLPKNLFCIIFWNSLLQLILIPIETFSSLPLQTNAYLLLKPLLIFLPTSTMFKPWKEFFMSLSVSSLSRNCSISSNNSFCFLKFLSH